MLWAPAGLEGTHGCGCIICATPPVLTVTPPVGSALSGRRETEAPQGQGHAQGLTRAVGEHRVPPALQRDVGVLSKDKPPSSQGSGWSQGGRRAGLREGLPGEELVPGLPRAEVWQGAWNVAEEDTSLWSLITGRFSRIYLEPLVVSGESFSPMALGAQKSPRGNRPLPTVCL